MTTPTADQIRRALTHHVELWNAREREAWLAHWRATCPGGYALEDPVGTPVKRGFDLLGEVWDRAFADTAWTITMQQCIVCANEAALVMVNEGTLGGVPVTAQGIEIYRFEDQSVHQRTFYELPDSTYADWTRTTGEGTSSV